MPETTPIDLKLSQQVSKSDEKLQIEENYIPNQESKKSSDSWEEVKKDIETPDRGFECLQKTDLGGAKKIEIP